MHPVLDHIVLLVPHQTLQNLPTWITDNFTVLNGGTHAGGETENKLIVFQDGTYIELIAFVDGLDGDKRMHHRWGRRSEGHIIDWALSLLGNERDGESQDPEIKFQNVQTQVREAQTGITYEDPVAGGRTTPAGKTLKWAISSPVMQINKDKKPENGQELSCGELPFWCLDRTSRSWRVPHSDAANVTHPSEVVGIAGIKVLFKDERWIKRLVPVYDAIHNFATDVNPGSAAVNEWQFQVPVPSGGHGWLLKLEATENVQAEEHRSGVSVHLKFVTKGEPRRISGTIVDGHTLEFDLVNVDDK